LIAEPAVAAAQALSIAAHGKVYTIDGAEVSIQAETICIHGDTSGAAEITGAVANTLHESGFILRSLAAN
jgi:UPF0271 protein